jgi:hypothetical protein
MGTSGDTMKFTNKMNYPDYVKAWLEHDSYDHEEGVLSATRLLAPIRQTILMKRHEAELETDVADLIASRYGTAIHESFEHIDMGPSILKEQRFYAMIGTQKISGKFDMLVDEGDGNRLVDIKSTSVWTYIYGSRDEDFIKQLSILRYILLMNQKKVKDEAHVVYVFTDWKKSDAKKNPDYPQQRIIMKTVKLNDMIDIWLEGRVMEIRKFADDRVPDDALPECTDEELWRKGDKYAVMKPGRKTAVKVFDELAMAKEYIQANNLNDCMVEHRKGSVARCNPYCLVRKWCNQYQRLLEEGVIQDEDWSSPHQ